MLSRSGGRGTSSPSAASAAFSSRNSPLLTGKPAPFFAHRSTLRRRRTCRSLAGCGKKESQDLRSAGRSILSETRNSGCRRILSPNVTNRPGIASQVSFPAYGRYCRARIGRLAVGFLTVTESLQRVPESGVLEIPVISDRTPREFRVGAQFPTRADFRARFPSGVSRNHEQTGKGQHTGKGGHLSNVKRILTLVLPILSDRSL